MRRINKLYAHFGLVICGSHIFFHSCSELMNAFRHPLNHCFLIYADIIIHTQRTSEIVKLINYFFLDSTETGLLLHRI